MTSPFRWISGGSLLLALLASACQARGPSEPAAPTSAPPAAKLVVGTSADYAPFAYYSADQKIDGFDPALIREIGRRMGVEVELQDMAFAGILNALATGQIDTAIAALTITPERQAQVDFSDVYYVSQDAALAAAAADIPTITQASELAPYRVGVQSDSIYESWVRTRLVDTGQMPLANLLSYPNMDQAVADLRAQHVDVVLLDSLTAQAYVEQGGVKIVGQDSLRQGFGIAVRKGNAGLKDNINRALTAMQQNGAISALAEKYLKVDPDSLINPDQAVIPPPATSAAPPPCVDGMALADAAAGSSPDAALVVPPGASFEQRWAVTNTGTCTWDTSYALVYVSGSAPMQPMSPTSAPIDSAVPSGATTELSVSLTAPQQPGTYHGVWQMVNGEGAAFGERLALAINVPVVLTATPLPTQTAAPTIVFTADPTSIQAGQQVTFSWAAPDSQAVFFSAQGQPWQQYPVGPQGSRVAWPASTTIYELHVVEPDSQIQVRQIQILVAPPPAGAPVIGQFAVSPSGTVATGQCVTLTWTVAGEVTSVRLLRNGSPIWDGAPVSGTMPDCPPGEGEVTYLLEATGPGGSSRASQSVQVTSTATPTAAPSAPPTITSFTVQPAIIGLGQCVSIGWTVQGDVQQVTLSRGDTVILNAAPVSGTAQDCPRSVGQIAYLLQAINAANQSAVQTVTITVKR